MALGAMASILGMIPLLAIGLNYYNYQSVDPENKVQEAQVVRESIVHLYIHRNYYLFLRYRLDVNMIL